MKSVISNNEGYLCVGRGGGVHEHQNSKSIKHYYVSTNIPSVELTPLVKTS